MISRSSGAPLSLTALSLVLIAVVVLMITAAAAGAQNSTAGLRSQGEARVSRDVVHRSTYWSWTGPRSWAAAYGAYGITVSSPSGTSSIDYGFSSTLCAPGNSVGQSVTRHFAAQRRALKQGPTTLTGAGKIRRIASLGPNYFRQTVSYRSRAGRIRLRGVAVLDYQVPDPTYCYQSGRSMTAPTKGFGRRIRALNRVFHSFAYFGPGAPETPDPLG